MMAGGLMAAADGLGAGGAGAEPADPEEIIALWPADPPGGVPAGLVEKVVERAPPGEPRDRAVTGIVRPTLTVFRPARPDGSAVMLVPGGAYERVVRDKEGFETARWLAERGVTAFILLYRLPSDGWAAGPDAPLQDAQRGFRLMRSRMAAMGLDPKRAAALGFSAGGHLTARLATRFERAVYADVDEADRFSLRPDLAGLLYPVITMREPTAHGGSRDNLLGRAARPEMIAVYSADESVGRDAPPTFLAHAIDDPSVALENSLLMLAALRRAKVPAELHAFEEGGHGFGIRKAQGLPAQAWPELFHAWGRRHGCFA
jgi:acetyl esterase/lipase